MPRSPQPDSVAVRSDAAQRLLARVRRHLTDEEADGAWRTVRVEVVAERRDPLEWLAAQPAASRVYWHGRDTRRRVAGIGIADLVEGEAGNGFEALQRRVDALDGSPEAVRYYGGASFDPAAPEAEEWAAFGAMRFVLPRAEYVVTDERAVLAANLVLPRDAARPEAVLAELAGLAEPLGQAARLPMPIARTDAPGPDGWRRGVEAALRAFETTEIEKVVLARRVTYDFDEPLDPFVLMRMLEEATPSCFHFLVQPALGVAFVGASPERLFRREGRRIESEAVAGTRPRGSSAATDEQLRRELLLSDKDRREHAYVRTHIEQALRPFSETLDADAETSDLTLARGRHLYAGLRAALQPGTRTTDLLRALHPTPAVGGTPTAGALARIAETEPFGRGWYAGPLGWIGADAAELAVGIRAGLIRQDEGTATLALYSGAGIVRGSEPAAEWAEIEHKIGDFARVLGLET